MIDQHIFRNDIQFVGSKGIVFIGDKMVVNQRDDKAKLFPLMMDLPGGMREEGESPFETFKREVFEEIGIHIEKADIVYAHQYESISKPNDFGYFFATRHLPLTEKDIVFGNEGLGYTLMTPSEFVSLDNAIQKLQGHVHKYLTTYVKRVEL
jgi:8-oxo-dGTP diphosphatase